MAAHQEKTHCNMTRQNKTFLRAAWWSASLGGVQWIEFGQGSLPISLSFYIAKTVNKCKIYKKSDFTGSKLCRLSYLEFSLRIEKLLAKAGLDKINRYLWADCIFCTPLHAFIGKAQSYIKRLIYMRFTFHLNASLLSQIYIFKWQKTYIQRNFLLTFREVKTITHLQTNMYIQRIN